MFTEDWLGECESVRLDIINFVYKNQIEANWNQCTVEYQHHRRYWSILTSNRSKKCQQHVSANVCSWNSITWTRGVFWWMSDSEDSKRHFGIWSWVNKAKIIMAMSFSSNFFYEHVINSYFVAGCGGLLKVTTIQVFRMLLLMEFQGMFSSFIAVHVMLSSHNIHIYNYIHKKLNTKRWHLFYLCQICGVAIVRQDGFEEHCVSRPEM